MCADCWTEAGSPANWTPEIAEALELVRELYAIHPTGGPLHVQLDDWNIDSGEISPWYECWDRAELDELYYDGIPIAELDPGAPAVVEGLGRSTRQLCDLIAAKMGPMTVEDRMSVLAYQGELTKPPTEEQA